MAEAHPPPQEAPFARLGIFASVAAGVVGLLVSVVCVAVPLLHFILGPLGPGIGGFVAGRLARGGLGRIVGSALTMAIGMALVAAALTGALFGEDPGAGWKRAAPAIVFVYTGALASVGAFFGTSTAPRNG